MITKVLFKQVIPGVILWYGGVHAYLAYHLYRSKRKIRVPEDLPITTIQPRREAMVESLLSIYQCRANRQTYEVFTHDSQFEDPIFIMTGLDEVRNLGFMMRSLTTSAKTLSWKDYHYENHFIMEIVQRNKMWGFEFELPSVLYVELEGEGCQQKIKSYREEWYGKQLLTPDNSPLVGTSFRFIKTLHAKIGNIKNYDPDKYQS